MAFAGGLKAADLDGCGGIEGTLAECQDETQSLQRNRIDHPGALPPFWACSTVSCSPQGLRATLSDLEAEGIRED